VGRFRFGQIIEVIVSDGRRAKHRPALIISSDADNDRGEDLLVVAITTKIETPCPPHHIVIVSETAPNPRSGLSVPCVAKCNWARDIKQDKVIRSLGFLDNDLLRAVVEQYDGLQLDNDFKNWI
jgi:mRNA-degrading endonuclease toxin of MazEF toxin-antitoxin module